MTAVLQVSILNGTDLKAMINYTGEQVSQTDPISALIHTKSFFMLQFLCVFMAWLLMRALNLLSQCKQK